MLLPFYHITILVFLFFTEKGHDKFTISTCIMPLSFIAWNLQIVLILLFHHLIRLGIMPKVWYVKGLKGNPNHVFCDLI